VLDRTADRRRVRGEQEPAEVDEVTPQPELLSHRRPRERRARLELGFRGERLRADQTGGRKREPGVGEEVSTVERHDPARS